MAVDGIFCFQIPLRKVLRKDRITQCGRKDIGEKLSFEIRFLHLIDFAGRLQSGPLFANLKGTITFGRNFVESLSGFPEQFRDKQFLQMPALAVIASVTKKFHLLRGHVQTPFRAYFGCAGHFAKFDFQGVRSQPHQNNADSCNRPGVAVPNPQFRKSSIASKCHFPSLGFSTNRPPRHVFK